ncbi:MAG: sulfite exporter TauE/SafE family protein [Clostridia bacterium]|nr:sulfite exporter TauE/SafE family protein [Clostridia bacterium]
MDWMFFVLVGLLSGVLAGMGMGGGTFLIPLLTILMGVGQKVAQGVNLAVFVVIGVVCVIVYAKKKLLKLSGIWPLYVSAIVVSGFGAFFADRAKPKTLQIIFGIFLVGFGCFLILSTIIAQAKKNKNK